MLRCDLLGIARIPGAGSAAAAAPVPLAKQTQRAASLEQCLVLRSGMRRFCGGSSAPWARAFRSSSRGIAYPLSGWRLSRWCRRQQVCPLPPVHCHRH